MKVIYYQKYKRGPFGATHFSQADCFYIPDKNVILLTLQNGTFGRNEYLLSTRKTMLEEARAIANREQPKRQDIEYGNIMQFEYDASKVQELIQNAELKSELEQKVASGLKELQKNLPHRRSQFPKSSSEPLCLPKLFEAAKYKTK